MARTPGWGCILVAALALGCGRPASDSPDVGDDHGAHVHTAPHGGTLVPLGEEFANVELVHDPGTGTLTAFMLGPHAAQPVRLSDASVTVHVQSGRDVLEIRLAAVASELTGETVGDTSEFRVTDERLVGRTHLEGSIPALTIRGRAFEAVPFRCPE